MRPRKIARVAAGCIVAATFVASSAQAYVIDFDSEFFTGPSLAGSTTAETIDTPTPIGSAVLQRLGAQPHERFAG
jgi:hypothetical protein